MRATAALNRMATQASSAPWEVGLAFSTGQGEQYCSETTPLPQLARFETSWNLSLSRVHNPQPREGDAIVHRHDRGYEGARSRLNAGVQGWVGVGVAESTCKRDREESRRRPGEAPGKSRSRRRFYDLLSLFKIQIKLPPSQDGFAEL